MDSNWFSGAYAKSILTYPLIMAILHHITAAHIDGEIQNEVS